MTKLSSKSCKSNVFYYVTVKWPILHKSGMIGKMFKNKTGDRLNIHSLKTNVLCLVRWVKCLFAVMLKGYKVSP